MADVNEGPTAITLSADALGEDAAGSTVVGTLSTTDPDAGESFSYAITDDSADLFQIDGDQLVLREGAALDFEAAESHAVTLQVTDAGGNTHTETVKITVADVNEGPTDIVVSGGSVNENAAAGTVVAELQGIDPDANDALQYELTGESAGLFKIVGNQVCVREGAEIDFEASTSHDVELRVIDSAGNSHSESLTIQVGDVAEVTPGQMLTGSDGADHIVGTEGNDQIDGGEGYDKVEGTRYNDVINVEDGMANIQNVEEIDGGSGYDTIQAGAGDDTIDLSNGPTLTGIDEVDGGYGNDHIIGTSGDDFIDGNRGDDVLRGGLGDDTPSGDRGDDTYVFDLDGSHDTFHGGSGWTDVLKLQADGGIEGDSPWSIQVNGEQVDYDLASHALDLDPDSSGTITTEDGSQLDFDGVDKIVW